MGLKGARTGSTVCSPERPVTLESIEVPDPVLEVTLEPRTHEDRDRLGETLARIVSDDPSLRVRVDDETGQTILCAMGQLHVEIVESHLAEAGISVRLSPPKVAYRSTIGQAAMCQRCRALIRRCDFGTWRRIARVCPTTFVPPC
jgi:elongation factor G